MPAPVHGMENLLKGWYIDREQVNLTRMLNLVSEGNYYPFLNISPALSIPAITTSSEEVKMEEDRDGRSEIV
jgi:hypothetical protein